MDWLRKLFGGEPGRPGSHAPQTDVLKVVWRPGSFPTDVVGESHYQAALSQLCGGHSRGGHELECTALLIPDPNNPHDSNAVKVTIRGMHVGYLAKEQAIRLGDQTTGVGRPGASVAAAAVIKGGWRTNQHDEGHFGVKLAIPGWGDIDFEGVERPRPPEPQQRSKRASATPVVLQQAELDALTALLQRLDATPLLSAEDAAKRSKKFYAAMAAAMFDDGVSSGVAADAPSHLTGSEEHFRAEMARMDNLLGEQIRIFQQGLDQWFTHGERFPPYYPYRIAVILRKAKRSDLEADFLRAYVRHFGHWRHGGARYAQIVERAVKAGVHGQGHGSPGLPAE